METTNEFSFFLKQSEHGLGVFTAHRIQKGTYLRLFGDDKKFENRARARKQQDVPEFFSQYCLDRGDLLMCPPDFGHMAIGWYLNHSKTPNAIHRNFDWYAVKDILSGEEITIDYNSLEEPEDAKEDYYAQ